MRSRFRVARRAWEPGRLVCRHALGAAKAVLLILLACVALSCSPPPVPPPTLGLRLATVPSLRPAADLLAQEYGKPGRHVEVTVSEGSIEEVLAAVALGKADVALLGRPLEDAEALNTVDGRRWLRAWPFASDVVAIAVHPSNPVQELDAAQLRRMYEGLERRWNQLGGPDESVRLVSREPGAPARAAFEGAFLAGTHIAGSAVIMPGDEAVRDYVAEHPGAVGYLSLAWANDAVKVIALDGVRPSPAAVIEGRYPLTHPIVAVARTGTAAKVRTFIGYCLAVEGREVLAGSYAPLP